MVQRKPDDDDGRRHGTSEGGREENEDIVLVPTCVYVYIQSRDSF